MRHIFKKKISENNNDEGDSSDYLKEIQKLQTWTKLHKFGYICV
jgi:hypothetical protein